MMDIKEKAKEIFKEYIETKGKKLRKTPERFAILDEIYSLDEHFDVDSLYISMKNKNYRVSRATIYNTIELLLETKLVIQHSFNKNHALYERAYKYKQHDHLVCNICGKVIEFCDPRIQQIQSSISESMNFEIQSHSLYFYGVCKDCK